VSCRRVCRELLWLARFGELGPDSQPHLEHLTNCRGCRDEIGFDRVMVEQLRAALAERTANAAPSPSAWEAILARARAPEPRPMGWRGWSSALVGRLRLTALAASGLALVLALNTQVVPMTVPNDSDAGFSETIRLARPPQRAASEARPETGAQPIAPVASVTDAVGAFTTTTPLPPVSVEVEDGGSTAEQPAASEVRVVFLPADTYPTDWPEETRDEPVEPDPVPLASEPGEPS
jgi:hypothetical protein